MKINVSFKTILSRNDIIFQIVLRKEKISIKIKLSLIFVESINRFNYEDSLKILLHTKISNHENLGAFIINSLKKIILE